MPNWSEEHFHIKSRIPKRKPVFKLADDLGDNIKGQFYEEELQPIEENRYLIKILIRKRITQQGSLEFLGKCKVWPKNLTRVLKRTIVLIFGLILITCTSCKTA